MKDQMIAFQNLFSSRLLIAVLWFGSLGVSGCGRDKANELFDSVNQSNVQRLANLYNVFQASNGFKGPKDEQQFKEFITNMHPMRHKSYGIDVAKIDEMFISERDNQPFKIRWELKATSRQGLVPIVFEQAGVGGKYKIGCSSFVVLEVDKAEYDEYWSGKRDGQIPESEQRQDAGKK